MCNKMENKIKFKCSVCREDGFCLLQKHGYQHCCIYLNGYYKPPLKEKVIKNIKKSYIEV